MPIYQYGEQKPSIDPSAFVAAEATVIGDVVLAEDASVWHGVVIRGDSARISVGKGSNVQDGAVLHADEGVPLTIGDNVTVGHQAMLHGCTIGDGTLVGIQAVVLNNAVIGRNCLIGAGAVVTEGKQFPDNSLIVGAPARVVREMSPEQILKVGENAKHYAAHQKEYRKALRRLD
jgi:carbonic anhydrase/acetyltransferase-like protein (isoleucine patch superfamily)